MPPKVKIPKEAIIEKAFELTKVYGFEKVTARLLASELKCSTQPVFHAFRNMEELKEEVYKKTQKLFQETMMQRPSDTETPYFLSMGLKYVELAQNEKNLFHLLCMSDSGTRLESLYDLAKHVPVSIEPEVFVKTWIFAHGIDVYKRQMGSCSAAGSRFRPSTIIIWGPPRRGSPGGAFPLCCGQRAGRFSIPGISGIFLSCFPIWAAQTWCCWRQATTGPLNSAGNCSIPACLSAGCSSFTLSLIHI